MQRVSENLQKMYKVCDYTRYREKPLEHELEEVAAIAQYCQQLRINIGCNVFTGLHRVNPPT